MSTKKTILIVEDDYTFYGIYKQYLRKNGYYVLLAPSGKRGIELLKSNMHIDLIVTDLMMSDVDGVTLLSQPETQTGIPIIVMSNMAGDVDLTKTGNEFIKYKCVKADTSLKAFLEMVQELIG